MKRALHRVLQGTGWTLVAAGTVGLSTGASGQSSSSAPLAVPRQASSVRPAHPAAWLTENYARLAEMRVELAWLADPKTYPYRFGARVNGMTLEVRGYVPDDSVRQHALRLAREETGLDIVDALRLQPRLSPRATHRPPDALEREAVRALQETFPHFGRHLEVQARADGQVTVAGTVNSYEEKLAVSHRLSRLSGCQSIVNSLRLQPLHQEGQQYTRVTSDGKLLVPNEDAPNQPATLVSQPGPGQLDEIKPHAVQPTFYQSDAASRPSEPVVLTPQTEQYRVPAPAQAALVPAPSALRPREPLPTYVPVPTRPPLPTLAFASSAPGTPPSPPAPANANAPAPPIRYYQTQWRRPEMAGQPPARVTPSASVEAQVSASTAASANTGASATSAPYVTTGVVLLESAEPAPTVTGQATSVPVQPPPEQPVVTTGVILIEIPEDGSPEPLPAAVPVVQKPVQSSSAPLPAAWPMEQKGVEGPSAPLPAAPPVERNPVKTATAPLPEAPVVVRHPAEALPLPAAPTVVPKATEPTTAPLPAHPSGARTAIETPYIPLPPVPPVMRGPVGVPPTPPAAPAVVRKAPEPMSTSLAAAQPLVKTQEKAPSAPLPAAPALVPKAPEPTSTSVPAVPPPPLRNAVEARLRQRIEAVCEGEARAVEIETQTANRVQIRLKARTDRAGERLSAKIFQMPELGPYQVSLDIQVVP